MALPSQSMKLGGIDPPPNQLYLSEWDVVRQATPLVNLTDVDTDIADPWSQAVQFKAAEYLLMKHQNFGQVTYYAQKYDSYVPRIIAGEAAAVRCLRESIHAEMIVAMLILLVTAALTTLAGPPGTE